MAKHIIVVGGGIIGASFAYHLAKAGSEVKVLDAGRTAGGVATPQSWAWINASWGNAEPYFRLRHHSMQLWRELDKEVAGLSVNWCGGLLWDLPPTELEAFVKQQSGWGYDIRLVTSDEVQQLEANLAHPPVLAAHAPGEAAVEPVHAVQKLLLAAKSFGADLLQGVRAKRIVEEAGRVVGVLTDDGLLEAETVVLAAGAQCNDLLNSLGLALDIEAPPGLLVHSHPVGEMLRGLVMSPELHVRQTQEGRLVAGTDFGGMDPGSDTEAAARNLFGKLQTFLKPGLDLRMSHFSVGYRPTPKDGVSAIGGVSGLDGLYICASHSGITLAPALGALGAVELLTGDRHELLETFQPERLMSRK